MSDPDMIKDIISTVTIPVMAKVRIGHFVEAQILEAIEVDYIDESERPDVVMPPDTVPKKITWAYRKGIIDRDIHRRLMVDIPRDVLGIDTLED